MCKMAETNKPTILERLDNGEVIIGDGGFVFQLEKRGYVKAGPWTPEAVIEHPEAVIQLHREFLRAGSDVMQALTFYASDDKLENRGNEAASKYTGENINRRACQLAAQVAAEGTNILTVGGVSQTPSYLTGLGKSETQKIFRKQFHVFKEEKVDFLLCEYFEHVEEAEWAVETAKEFGLPVACSLCIGPHGDLHDVPTGECALRLVKAGAHIVGINCHYDPFIVLKTVKIMIAAVRNAGLKAHFMIQPLAYMTPDASKQGFIDLPEFPFALEPRICTRFDMQKYAREAYEAGIQYIGGCCGFEAYHIRAVAEELAKEHGRFPEGTEKHEIWGGGLRMHTKPWVRARAKREYWEKLSPCTGRPLSAAYAIPDEWGVTAKDPELKQQAEKTEDVEIDDLYRHLLKLK